MRAWWSITSCTIMEKACVCNDDNCFFPNLFLQFFVEQKVANDIHNQSILILQDSGNKGL